MKLSPNFKVLGSNIYTDPNWIAYSKNIKQFSAKQKLRFQRAIDLKEFKTLLALTQKRLYTIVKKNCYLSRTLESRPLA